MSDKVERLPLHQRHEALGARFTPFAGFQMPIRFGSIMEEHAAVRTNMGLFDVSHMGEVELRGDKALAVTNSIVTNDVAKLDDGQALYTVMCHSDGGIVDDLLVYRLAADHILACVNAANRAKDYAHIAKVADGRCEVIDRSDDYVQLAVQGPNAVDLVQSITDAPVSELGSFRSVYGDIAGIHALISRTGYTGEDGVEIYYPVEGAVPVFDAIWAAGEPKGLKPIGLGARDTLRLEAKLMLYGNDITDDTTPLEAGLSWVVKYEKGDFRGRDALLTQKAEGVKRRMRGLVLQGRGMLRPHYPVFLGDEKIGETTSGGPSPTLGGSIALAYLDVPEANAAEVDVEVRGKRLPCSVTRKPFYKRAGG